MAIQALGFISGILVIRVLPTHEYALYTLANTMLGTMTVLADGGIASGVMAQGGKVWHDKEKLGAVLSTGMELRKKFAVGSLLIATPVLIYLLRHHEASWLMTTLIILSLIPAFFSPLSGTLLQIPLKLKQDITPLQKNQVGVNIGRLFMLMLTMFVFPWAFVAVLAAGLPQIWANIRLRKISTPYADWTQESDREVKTEILAFVKRIMPGAIYYCLSGQVSIWLISLFGSTSSVAELGALGRLAMMLSLFSVLFSTLITPRFSRLVPKKRLLLKKYLYIQFGLLMFTITVVTLVWIFPSEILWVLGKDYSNLEVELVLSIAGSCINLMAGLSFGLFTSRGFAINPFVSFPISILSIVCGAVFIDISSLKGVLVFNVFIASIQLVMNGMYGGIKLLK